MGFGKQIKENAHLALLITVAVLALAGLMMLYDDMSITAYPVWTNYANEMETPDIRCPQSFPYITPIELARPNYTYCVGSNMPGVACCSSELK